jgi:hypothetical protein
MTGVLETIRSEATALLRRVAADRLPVDAGAVATLTILMGKAFEAGRQSVRDEQAQDGRGGPAVSVNYNRTEETETRVVYRVPAMGHGAGYSYWGELRKALHVIVRELGDRAEYEDSVRIEAADDEIVLSFRKDQP